MADESEYGKSWIVGVALVLLGLSIVGSAARFYIRVTSPATAAAGTPPSLAGVVESLTLTASEYERVNLLVEFDDGRMVRLYVPDGRVCLVQKGRTNRFYCDDRGRLLRIEIPEAP